ncbi:hypothetical protein CONPUDRAFT_92166 [Coniophora puteana RWD-64-598 SS2]|uniref:DDE Tnp4 domain-containing protein n=1 Tax=Coniophora puteana (strain RWD-64-598) TaxID=741705 RepID=A0A5M3MEY7_CONPW|nr:uncharacterized protein CONPUDRAFT_92166 [Coniophora puteana RWD-64-598 SS2]EIW77798.1 hypothetical protein CONPUDRAFT_92166 [Coniophora puteana RWD-64-598 SS2]
MDDYENEVLLQALEIELEAEEEEEEEEETRLITAVGLLLWGAEQSRLLRNERRLEHRLYLVRADLLPNPRADTPWQVLYAGMNRRAYITTMGVDVETFDYILASGFGSKWNALPIPRDDTNQQGRARLGRRSLDAAGALGLVLHYLNSTMRETSLMQIFALIPSTVSRYIRFAMRILLRTLRHLPEAAIVWPQGDQFFILNDAVVEHHPLLTGAFGVMDGVNIPVQTADDDEIENATYNGWLHDHFVSSVFAFGPDGTILMCRINAPGSWHDSRVAQPIYQFLRTETPDGFYLVADTAFPRGTEQIAGRIKTPMKSGQRLPHNEAERQQVLAFDAQLVSFRQAAEWGMRTLQGSFGRLRIPLNIGSGTDRADLLEVCARLSNVRARLVGINQIRSVYMPIWKKTEQERVWRDFEHMLFGEQRRLDRVARFHHV